MLSTTLKDLNFSENSIRIYERLIEAGYCSARKLSENLNLPRATVYDNLDFLIENNLVVRKEEENKTLFGIDNVKNIQTLIRARIENLEKNENAIKAILPNLILNNKTFEPKIKFYSGPEGIRKVLNDLLWYDNIETLTMWPVSEMVEILGKEYLENLNRRRIRQNISIRGIWPRDKAVDFKNHPFLGVGKKHLRELRLAPKNLSWDMSYWLYADKVAFISSRVEGFGFVISSHDFADLIKKQFEVIWKISKPIPAQPKYTDSFLKTV
jgi:HTH-type transcriptional regulator, sugar sensing transcriptional regulator